MTPRRFKGYAITWRRVRSSGRRMWEATATAEGKPEFWAVTATQEESMSIVKRLIRKELSASEVTTP